MSASSLLALVLLWSTALDLLSERSGPLLSVVDAEAGAAPLQVPNCTATTDGGRYDRIHGGEGCPRVTEGAKECARQSIDLQDYDRGCSSYCYLPGPNFCNGEQARNVNTSHFPISITYSVPNHMQFTATASVRNLTDYMMMMTDHGATMIIGNRCTCGSTQNEQKVSINRTAYFSSAEQGSLHLCLRNSSGSRFHYVHNFFIGSECSKFVDRHHLPSHLCNQPISGSIGRVKNLTVQPTSTSALSTLQVSWSKPDAFKYQTLRGKTYHLTLSSTQGTHTFNVSDSTSVTCAVEPGLNYTVTVRTRIWCEASSCEAQASESQFIPDLTTPASPSTSHASPAATSATDRYSTNVTTIVIASSASGAVVVFLMITMATIVYCQCRIKERYSYSAENQLACSPAESSHTRIANSCSSDLVSTPPVDSSSDNSVKISDLVPATSSMHQIISMEGRAQSIAEWHTDSEQVLIVGSQRTSIEDQVELVAVPLKEYGIKILMYGVESDMDTPEQRKYHGRPMTPSTWVQREMDRAKFVVCICNEEFRDDWCYDGQEMCHEVSLVRSVSQHVSGQMNHGLSSAVESKFVVVVRSEKDSRYIPGGLKNCNAFVLNCEANVQRLASLLLGRPMVIFTQRIDHISSRL